MKLAIIGNETPRHVCNVAIAIARQRTIHSKIGIDAQCHPLRPLVDKLIVRYAVRGMKVDGTLTPAQCSRFTDLMYRAMDADALPATAFQIEKLARISNSAAGGQIFPGTLTQQELNAIFAHFNRTLGELRSCAYALQEQLRNGSFVPQPVRVLLGSLNSISANLMGLSFFIYKGAKSAQPAHDYKSREA